MTRIRKASDVELGKLGSWVTEELLVFNITKKQIAERANVEGFGEPWETDKNYSTWHRALDGHPVWLGIVQVLEDLLTKQQLNPRAFLPSAEPPEEEDALREWMRDVAGGKWWHRCLVLTFKENTLC